MKESGDNSVDANYPLSISHIGNTANNAYFNFRVLESTGLVSSSGIVEPVSHAMSAPAWDSMDFQIPRTNFVESPFWLEIPGAIERNSEYLASNPKEPFSQGGFSTARFASKLEESGKATVRAFNLEGPARKVMSVVRNRNLMSRELRQEWSAGRSRIDSYSSDVCIFYGTSVLGSVSYPRSRVNIILEHGNVRWLRYGSESDQDSRERYLERLKCADHVWVTNLDDATLEIADEYKCGKWSALPHPYFLDPDAPYKEDPEITKNLHQETSSDFLVFMPSSINWLKDHDKGSRQALETFIAVREAGLSIGLVAVRWGRQLEDAVKLLKTAGVDASVKWIDPQPRIPMQRLMASVDVVWDQFHYGMFGGVAMKSMEQGVPLITHPVDRRGAALMGSAPPFLEASNGSQLEEHVKKLYEESSKSGRSSLKERYGDPLREWIISNHHHEITASIQMKRYQELLQPISQPSDAKQDAWALEISENGHKYHSL